MRKALLQLHTAVFLWGFTGVLGRVITLDQTWLVWYRLLITAVSLWVLYYFLQKIRKLPVKDMLFIGFIGFIQALHWVFFYGSIKYANITIALTTLSTAALLAAVIEPLFLKKRFDPVEVFLGFFCYCRHYHYLQHAYQFFYWHHHWTNCCIAYRDRFSVK